MSIMYFQDYDVKIKTDPEFCDDFDESEWQLIKAEPAVLTSGDIEAIILEEHSSILDIPKIETNIIKSEEDWEFIKEEPKEEALESIEYQEIDKIILNSTLSTNNQIISSNKGYKCDSCDYSSERKCDLNRHYLTHLEKRYICDKCDKKFSHANTLRRHELTHSGVRKWKCYVCGECFLRKCNLTGHMAIHSGIKPFKCEYCDTSFIRKFDLKTHTFIHTGDRPYACEICDKRYSQMSTLYAHMATHSSEKPFKCTVCDQKFKRKDSVKKHMKKHV
ncbi:unnamed protein product [Meganyctiphanes norvegica]|uniref:C2H2-type domain-containing protein n=1 Tax=Meganyctiphanes norvegica TaxID=48144 RepID=A0AAV2PP17_MEGNR